MANYLKLLLEPKSWIFVAFIAHASVATATELPSRIEAESFDAYFDTTSGSSDGSLCNTTDVDARPTYDTDGLCDVGPSTRGEWTEYVVTSPGDARYDLSLRVATAPKNIRVRVEIDGVDVSGAIAIPQTGWQNYADVVVPVEMTAGEHTVRIVHDTGKMTLNYLEFITTWSALTADDDADGVVNANDLCPSTAPDQSANADGCSEWQLDDDKDQVVNAEDSCPATSTGEGVDSAGCSDAQRDDDSDGVNNGSDYCPATPAGETADATGCGESQLDDDGDSINNPQDLCPGTAAGESIDSNGCSFAQRDDDFDSVPNAEDSCPATPTGEAADLAGCSDEQRDDDNDSVNNGVDLCPATPTGESVDGTGCSWSQLDDDGDSINNPQDLCPGTAAGEAVDSNGCSTAQFDDDGDGVSNHADMCPVTPTGESVSPDGCSDSQRDDDSDGVNNTVDMCPASASHTVTDYGCDALGDEDFDHVRNERDLCPFNAGLVELEGCPSTFNDFDGDGISDVHDLCPYSTRSVKQASNNDHWQVDSYGCSTADRHEDHDNDGISDGVDRCPTSSGVSPYDDNAVKHLGVSCFDRELDDDDHDGVINGLDLCEAGFGHKQFNGCPFGKDGNAPPHDLDGDFINNEQDHCPFSASGNALMGPNGCWSDIRYEDHDLDGVANGRDDCPLSPLGHAVNSLGCTGKQQHQQQDSDNDGVNNGVDLCPDFASPEVSLFGCDMYIADYDFDGMPDAFDQCPSEPGLRLNHGCKETAGFLGDDADGDGLPLPDDLCPYSTRLQHASLVTRDGCFGDDYSDFDADGVINGQDFCPNTSTSAFVDSQGCSDYDRLDFDTDGVMNGLDLCPNWSGTRLHNGCSRYQFDADMDGTPNEVDQCRNTPAFSFMENPETGCAHHFEEDQDGDGIRNGMDECAGSPVAIPVGANGCTFTQQMMREDQDNDGVGDPIDFCPGTTPHEPVDKHGCPVPPTFDNDGDNVPNDIDRCDHTPHATALDHEGCEISRVPVVTQNIARSFPTEANLIHISREDIVFAENPHVYLDQPIEFEIGGFLMQREVMVHVWGEMIDIDVPPHLRTRPIEIPLRVKLAMDGQVSNWFTLTIGGAGVTGAVETLIVNDPAVLEQSNITLRQVFRLMAGPTAPPEADLRLFRQLWDSQRSHSVLGLPMFCEGHFNGFPIVCDRPETDLVFLDDLQLAMEMEQYRLAAVVNRLDKHRNWEDCGEQRLVFGLQSPHGGRKFLNIEARLPNPTPMDIAGCRPIVDFWLQLPMLDEPSKSAAIFEFFYGGRFGMPAVISPEHFAQSNGQVRSTQFAGGEWLFKEHKIEALCGVAGPECENFFRTVSVKENPFGELFNPQTTNSGLPWAHAAMEFQQSFTRNLQGLLTPNIADLQNPVDDRFNHGQSHASGMEMLENDYSFHFAGQFGSPFGQDLWNATMGQHNADGSPLEVEHLLARATAMTCAGCHAPEAFGLTQPGRIGVLQLPNGERIDAWPRSLDFVHINEFGELSPALKNVFLPARQFEFEKMVEALR